MIGNPRDLIQWLCTQSPDGEYEVKEYHQKRSTNANAYCWTLICKIADVLRTDKDSVYLSMLKRYGQQEIVSVLSGIDMRGYFKYYEVVGQGHVGGKEFTHYRVYKGSSEYNTKEMAVLIDGIIQDAQELEIETLPPREIERMKKRWNV